MTTYTGEINPKYCIGKVRRHWHYSQCSRLPRKDLPGGQYCKQHHPDVVAARNAKRTAAWKKMADKKERREKFAVESERVLRVIASIDESNELECGRLARDLAREVLKILEE